MVNGYEETTKKSQSPIGFWCRLVSIVEQFIAEPIAIRDGHLIFSTDCVSSEDTATKKSTGVDVHHMSF